MDKVILNGNKARFYNEGNTQSGSIQYTDSKLSIGNSAGSGVLITDGKLHLKSGTSTSSIVYDSNTQGVQFPDGLIIIGSGSNVSSVYNDNGNVHIDSGITVSNLNIEYTEGVAANIQGRVQFGSGVAIGEYSHAQGLLTEAIGDYSHAEGDTSQAIGFCSHAEGYGTTAQGVASHAEGDTCTAQGANSHAEGSATVASGYASHTEGYGTTTSTAYQLAIGSCNTSRTDSYFVVGTGSFNNRADGFWVTKTGQANAGLGFSSSGYLKIGSDITAAQDISSPVYVPGFDPTNQGNRGFAIKNVNNRYVAQFDDLYVRGKMNVHQFVINQIRATNGSLWVSDAAKAISASISGDYLYLYFESGSTLPFKAEDIIRSKRWIITDDEISNWDIITVVQLIDYTNFIVTASLLSANCYTASNQSLPNLLHAAGSQWVRIGNLVDLDRMGGIYLTSGDNNSPYIDIYDGVQSIAQSHNQDSGSVHYDKLKVRLGKLQGVSLGGFQNMSGYGLYSDNVYLKGTISATAGTFSGLLQANQGNIAGWQITNDSLYKSYGEWSIAELSTSSLYFGDIYNAILIGTCSALNGWGMIVGNDLEQDKTFPSSYTHKFRVDSNGAFINGQVVANSGVIGGWNLNTTYLASGNMTISSVPAHPAIYIGATAYNQDNGIYIGSQSGFGNRLSLVSGNNKLLWNNSYLEILSPYFTLSNAALTLTGSINATSGNFTGQVNAGSGNIGGWTINPENISSSGIQLLAGTSPAIKIGATSYGSSGIWMGKDASYKFSLADGTTKFLKWDGTNLQIKAGNFTLSTAGDISASNVVLDGQIRANSGKIAGWDISGDTLYASKITFSGGSSSYISLGGATAVNTGAGIFLTSSANNAFLRVGEVSQSSNKFIQWDGSDLIVNSNNFRLSNGNISASSAIIGGTIYATDGQFNGKIMATQGQIAGWDIQQKFLASDGISIRTQTSSTWNLVSKSGVSYNDITGNQLFGQYDIWLNASQTWFTKSVGTTQTYDSEVILKFTSSYQSNSMVFASMGGINIPDKTTMYFGLKNASITTSLDSPYQEEFNQSEYYQSIAMSLYNGSTLLTQITLFNSQLELTRKDVQFSYQNTSSSPLVDLSISISCKSLRTPLSSGDGIYELSLNTLISSTASGYTELNPEGLLVWAGPTNFIKISTIDNNQYASLAVDELYVNGEQVKGGQSTGGGGGTIQIPNHNDLTGLNQGDYLHLSSSQYTNLTGTSTNFTNLTASVAITTSRVTASSHISSSMFYGNGSNITNITTSNLQGILPIVNGGTNNTDYTTNNFIIYDGTKLISSLYDSNSYAMTGHAHGQISKDGTIASGLTPTLDEGDRLLFADANDGFKIKKTNIAITSRQTSKYLSENGIWSVPANTTYSAGTGLNLSSTTFNHNVSNGFYHLPSSGTSGQILVNSGTAGSGSWTSDLNEVNIGGTYFESANGTITSGVTATMSSVSTASYTGAFFEYTVKSGSNVRIGTIMGCHNGTSVQYTQNSTMDLGDTSDIKFEIRNHHSKLSWIVINSGTSTWIVKGLTKAM